VESDSVVSACSVSSVTTIDPNAAQQSWGPLTTLTQLR
jgi:hypothetical protein